MMTMWRPAASYQMPSRQGSSVRLLLASISKGYGRPSGQTSVDVLHNVVFDIKVSRHLNRPSIYEYDSEKFTDGTGVKVDRQS